VQPTNRPPKNNLILWIHMCWSLPTVCSFIPSTVSLCIYQHI